jgi:hypothetical protein
VIYCAWTSQTSDVWRRAICEVNPKVVEEPATSTFGIEHFSISTTIFLHRRKETRMGQSFLCLCTASRERRMEVVVQFYIFLTSRVFGVESSTVRLCFFTPLYPTASLEYLTTDTNLVAKAEVSADVRNRLSPYHKEAKNFIYSTPDEHRKKTFENTVIRHVSRCFHGIEATYFDLFLTNSWCLFCGYFRSEKS